MGKTAKGRRVARATVETGVADATIPFLAVDAGVVHVSTDQRCSAITHALVAPRPETAPALLIHEVNMRRKNTIMRHSTTNVGLLSSYCECSSPPTGSRRDV